MPLNWKALYPQIRPLAAAEVARRRRLAEQVSAVAEELAAAELSVAEDKQAALTWLGTAIRAWESVLECYPEDSPGYRAGGQKRQQLQQMLLSLLRQAE
jgi:hypothetical protein